MQPHAPSTAPELRQQALRVLLLRDPADKAAAARSLYAERAAWALEPQAVLTAPPGVPGRPERPALVEPGTVPTRSPFTTTGRAALIHALAHIEFNAINLALDAIWRYPGMPEAYYLDWLQVADEEALHFSLLREHLRSLGFDYCSFDAHDGLWIMCEKTAHDLTARMALVPRTLEARGLDATPLIQAKLKRAGDDAAAAILDVILRDEIGHVAIGNRWYRQLCEQQGLEPIAHYNQLVEHYGAPKPRPPLNLAAREAAGFSADELAYLQGG